MPNRVYIETTIASYLTARPSRDVVIAGHQQTTHEWWNGRRQSYELCVSEVVLEEAALGDPEAAQQRLEILSSMSLLQIAPEALSLAEALVQAGALPKQAAHDALHIAVAAVNGIPYLMTWNCRHLANATMRPVIESVCAAKGFKAPIICTPEELLGTGP
jgi:predicted nucleic acid-binding protein